MSWLAVFFVIIAVAGTADGMEISGYSSDRHDRFLSGFPNDPVPNPDIFASGYDWSGVGWDTSSAGRNVALVSPQHFLCSNHNRPSGDLAFLNQNGDLHTYSIASFDTTLTNYNGSTYTSDLCLGTLSAPIPAVDLINYYPIYYSPYSSDYIGRQLLVYGKEATVGRNDLQQLVMASGGSDYTASGLYDYDPVNGYSVDEAFPEVGDSGGTTMLPLGGYLTVFGTHFLNNSVDYDPPVAVDTFAAYYAGQLDAAMQDEGYSLWVVTDVAALPEPASLSLFLLSGLLLALRRDGRTERKPSSCRAERL